ncbi:MAG TPA: hypothetical protein VJT49_22150 [Amycolatopsis sp.]|uniref:hypothetical protein n=1 Tax=Amycolatopsis sp. TaxID=37632 RepID=UPI002B470AF7|nr:hypothetical protein [Amycolatopsis sp.]HKS47763.1 hypothetical protein [Amycolatopsis sp.]
MDPCRAGFGSEAGGVHYEPCALDVRLEQGYRAREPRVQLEAAQEGGRFVLTLAEAERLGKPLAKAVALAGSD